MSEPNVLVNFRLDKEAPLRFRWLATDGVPGDGYKAQITAIRLTGGGVLEMDSSSIVEQTAPDAAGGIGGYLLMFSGMVGIASVICGTVLAAQGRSAAKSAPDAKPVYEPDAFDVVGTRG